MCSEERVVRTRTGWVAQAHLLKSIVLLLLDDGALLGAEVAVAVDLEDDGGARLRPQLAWGREEVTGHTHGFE